MAPKVIKLLKNKTTGQIINQTYTKQTIFHRFKEKDFIQIGRLLWYNYNVQINPNIMDTIPIVIPNIKITINIV